MLEQSYGLSYFLKSSKNQSTTDRYVYIRITVDGIPKEKDFIYYLTMVWVFATIAGFSITTGLTVRKERSEKSGRICQNQRFVSMRKANVNKSV